VGKSKSSVSLGCSFSFIRGSVLRNCWSLICVEFLNLSVSSSSWLAPYSPICWTVTDLVFSWSPVALPVPDPPPSVDLFSSQCSCFTWVSYAIFWLLQTLDFGVPNMIKFEIFYLLKLFGCSDISFSSWLAGPCSLMPMVPQYCEAYFSDPFSYYLPPLSVYVVDTTIGSGMYFLSCLWHLCCSSYRHLLTSTWCVLDSWNLFSQSFLVVFKHLSILGGMFVVSILNFPRKLLILADLKRTVHKGEKRLCRRRDQ